MGGRVLAEVGKDQIENKERNEEILQEFQQKLNSSLSTLDQLVIQNIPRVSGEEYTKLVQLLSHIQDSSSSSGGPLTTCGGYLTIKDSGLVKVVRSTGGLQWVLPHEVDVDEGVNEADGVEERDGSVSGEDDSDSHKNDVLQDEDSVHEFEVMTSPDRLVLSPDTKWNPETDNPQCRQSRRVNFLDGLISETFIHREKHSPEDVPDLFYTHDESIKFQYDYDREAQRADNEGISWLDWMMKRTEEERKKHEVEDDLLQQEYQDYWEGNDQYEEEESQSEDEMWEF